MTNFQLPCLLGDDSCQFVTIQLEFSQAKEILEMHMKLVHPVPDCYIKKENPHEHFDCRVEYLVNNTELHLFGIVPLRILELFMSEVVRDIGVWMILFVPLQLAHVDHDSYETYGTEGQ